MGYVTPVTKTAGDGLTAADWNAYVRDNQEALHVPPRCLLTRSSTQSIPDATSTAIDFNVEDLDNDAMHSVLSNPTRVTAKTAGLYVMSAGVQFEANSTGQRTLSINLNGSFTIVTQDVNAPASGVLRMNISTIYYLDEDDYVEAAVQQNSTGALNVNATSDTPFFRVAWIGG